MIIYGASMSPYVRKVLVFAAEKGIEVENVSIGIASDDAEFRAASPFGKIPALRDPGSGPGAGGEFTVSDSSAIIAYLDALAPEPNLIPAEPRARARTTWFDEFADTLVMDCGRKMFFNRVVAPMFLGQAGDMAVADKAEREQLPPLLDYLEGQIPDSGFLVEDRFTLADIAVASPLANVVHHLGISIDRYPRLSEYVEGILARPSFAVWLAKETRLFDRVRAAAGAG